MFFFCNNTNQFAEIVSSVLTMQIKIFYHKLIVIAIC